MKTYYLLLLLFLITVSCTKINEIYSGKNIDNEIIGKWTNHYTMRDLNNGITLYSDSVAFNLDNTGIWAQYKFNEVYNSDPFSFYTEDNNLHIYFEKIGVRNIWSYNIQNDTLIIEKGKYTR
jgi:hypothetical protein